MSVPALAARLAVAIALLAACGVRHPALPDGRPRFTALADGTVRDEATRLEWSGNGNLPGFREPFEGATWEEAETFVAAMNRGERPNLGHDDWRLPSAKELGGLVSGFWVPRSWLACRVDGLGSGCTELASFAPFVDLQSGIYWTMTPGKDGRVWAIDTRRIAMPSPRDALRRVLPVRGAPPEVNEPPALRPLAPSGALSTTPPIVPVW